jgi:threonine dehydrogenase-like Zn-dependent dehydrogenase
MAGLATLLAARAMGATELVITDLRINRLDTATELGATKVLQVKKAFQSL